MVRKLSPFSSVRSFVVLVCFILLAIAGTRWVFNFSYGAQLLFCSAFLFVILYLFGLYWASAAAVLVTTFSYFVLDGPIYLLLVSVEIIIVGSVYSRKKRFLFIWDGLFWAVLGAPLAGLLFYLQTGSLSSEMYLQMFMIAMNGLLNGLIGDVIITYLPWKRLFPQMKKRTIYLNQLLTHLSIMAVIGPFLLNTYLDSFQIRERVEHDSFLFIENQTRHLMDELYRLNEAGKQGSSMISVDQNGHLTEQLKHNSANGVIKMGVFFKDGSLAAASESDWFMDQHEKILQADVQLISSSAFYQDARSDKTNPDYSYTFIRSIPTGKHYDYDTWRWNNGFYILTTILKNRELNKIVTAIPISYYQQSTITAYMNKFIAMFTFCAIATVMSLFFNSFLMSSLNQLMRMTTDLPSKLRKQQYFAWPRTAIYEFSALVTNFRIMSDRVVQMFREMKVMNDQLMAQTKMLEKSEERLQQLAYYDTLTGLPNRHHFSLYLERAIDEAEQHGYTLAVLFIDLDRFKHVNDTLGHDVGDLLLADVAKRLGALFDPKTNATCARLGGDEFVVVLQNVSREEIDKQAEAIIADLTGAFEVKRHELFVAASIGISLYPQDGDDYTAMLKNADTAMYHAKDKGGSCYQYYDEMKSDRIPERMMLENSLRKAMERGEILLHYQPLLDDHGAVVAAEALIRWEHPERGFISPAQFIPLAEETGQIIPIGEWVLRTACEQHLKWLGEGLPPIRMSVNVSLRQFSNQDFVKNVDRILLETQFDPSYLILEITEGYFHTNTEHAICILKQLNDRGIQIAIDDFGTGYSSLSRLRKLPIHILKLDQSFVRHLPSDHINASIAKTVIQLGHSLNVKVAAEGIETLEELEFLHNNGCDKYQGYLFSRPLSPEQFSMQFSSFSTKEAKTVFRTIE